MSASRRERLRARFDALRARLKPLGPFRARIAATLIGAVAGGRLFAFGAAVGCLLGAMLDALAARSRDEKASGAQEAPEKNAESCAAKELAQLYAVFGLEPGAERGELAKAYKRRSRRCHPDASGGTADEFLALKTAYDRIGELEGWHAGPLAAPP